LFYSINQSIEKKCIAPPTHTWMAARITQLFTLFYAI